MAKINANILLQVAQQFLCCIQRSNVYFLERQWFYYLFTFTNVCYKDLLNNPEMVISSEHCAQ
ncbi:hypothetical protein T4E_2279 [Trichinella pseudospiralis]|uniref:Uncharacterized protein n=1 Tax=Trichinella pseudospiralis TaxID=6337 RepID=A0A0V0XDL4_TRIPS|nr:hypothetical protein T4E_2279 [Trichinella pseudospiralis]